MSEELKLCPFCKCTEIVAGKDYADGSYRVDCLGCFAYVKAKSLDLAIKAWQSRPIEDGLRAELARRDEIIARLKEDAIRLADGLDTYWQSIPEGQSAITLHRALMKELAEC